jgi:DNA invertase Pin-like site-specific DNA recombinase
LLYVLVMGKRTTKASTDSRTAVAYLRVSTAEQDLGPEAQRASIEAWSRREGVTVISWHEDRGVSGATGIEDRPALLAALDALRAAGAGALVVAKRDRLARDPIVSAMVERMVQSAGARLLSAAGEGTDGDSPADVLMRRMLDAFAEHERLIIRARTKAAMQAKKARGERVGSVPTGFQLSADGRTLTPDSHEQEAIALARTLRAQGLSYAAIGAALDARGFKARGTRWFPMTVQRALAA